MRSGRVTGEHGIVLSRSVMVRWFQIQVLHPASHHMSIIFFSGTYNYNGSPGVVILSSCGTFLHFTRAMGFSFNTFSLS
jgi:hypothetical protein